MGYPKMGYIAVLKEGSLVNCMTVRKALRRQRIAARLTLDAVAQRSGLNRATIHSVENVRREPHLKPEFDTISRLVAALGLKLCEFFEQIENAGRQRSGRASGGLMTGVRPRGVLPPTDEELSVVAAIDQLGATFDRGIERLLKSGAISKATSNEARSADQRREPLGCRSDSGFTLPL
jgi:transcriptional regulator with XRE-family HTH domain